MKEKTPKEKIMDLCADIRREIAHWKNINQSGCNDPFWADGCNMNLTRNHIIYDKMEIERICKENSLPLPEEYYLSTPPEIDDDYMANRKQRERVKRLKQMGDLVSAKYSYDENQMSLF